MTIVSEGDLEGLRTIGGIVARALNAMRQQVREGITTLELDAIADAELCRHGARATPRHLLGFPGASCISVNSEAVHGIPSKRVLRTGDVVKLDITADLDGFVADAARTVVVGGVGGVGQRLADCARRAFLEALTVAIAGRTTRDLGRKVEQVVHGAGFAVLRALAGHGVGREIHEPPCVPNYDEPLAVDPLTPGLVIALEPIIAARHARLYEARDGWTLGTADGTLTAHHEETIVITHDGAIVVTGDAQFRRPDRKGGRFGVSEARP